MGEPPGLSSGPYFGFWLEILTHLIALDWPFIFLMRVRSCLRSNSIFPICSIRNWISGNSLLTCSITYIFFLFIHEYIFRYSIWLDSKLRLQLYPLLILEYFMWWKSYKYVLSNHYDRHCAWEEVTQNKRLNKYNHTTINHQFSFSA